MKIQNHSFFPNESDSKLAQKSLALITSDIGQHPKLPLVELSLENHKIKLPRGFLSLLLELLNQTAQGHAVTIIPASKDFTTQEVADFLNVSRPFVIKLLEQGKMPFHKVGRHRRVKASDLLTYKQNSDLQRLKDFEELAKLDQNLDLGYG